MAALLTNQRNELIPMIRSVGGFDPADFHWEDRFSPHDERLRFKDSEYCFDISFGGNEFSVSYSPAARQIVKHHLRVPDWPSVKGLFHSWLASLQGQTRQPDLWAELAQQRLPQNLHEPDVDNRSFTKDEQDALTVGLRELEAYIAKAVNPPQKQLASLNEKVQYLIDATRRHGGRDWFNMAIGVLMGIMVELSITDDIQRAVWQLLKSLVTDIVPMLTD